MTVNGFSSDALVASKPAQAIAAGSTHTLGLCVDGTVVSTGNNADDQCKTSAWTEVQIVR